jgi:hypothetical protein
MSATSKRDRRTGSPWRPPTRRAFVAMLGAAAAALAARTTPELVIDGAPAADEDRPRRTWTGTTRWIGHC